MTTRHSNQGGTAVGRPDDLTTGITVLSEAEKRLYEDRRWWSGRPLGDLIDKIADVYPDKEALVDDQGRYTYRRLRDRADRLAIGLLDRGLGSGDRVLLQLPNWHEFVVAYFALQKIGAVPVILIARYRQYEINQLAQMSGASAWIVAERIDRTDYLPMIRDVQRENPGMLLVVVCRSLSDHGHVRFEDLIEQSVLTDNGRRRLADHRPDPNAIAHLGPTGGTTGVPKIAAHTHNSLICKLEYSSLASEFNQTTICLVVLPAAHDLPFVNAICATIFAGGRLVFGNHPTPADICRLIEAERVNTAVFVPTLTYRLVNDDITASHDLTSLSLIYCGGGASSLDLIQRAVDRFQCTYIAGYGGTEGMLVTTRRPDPLGILCQTIGKPTCPYDHYQVIDEKGVALPANQVGHLVVKGPSMFCGYVGRPKENEDAFTKDGYFKTGDLAAIDESGYIRLAGRLKDTIKRGGESIFAPEIENLISGHPDVAVVAVVGTPDPEMGERVLAVIQPRPGVTLTFDQIIDYLKDQATSVLQRPEFIQFVDDMPLTPTGKVDKKTLKSGLSPHGAPETNTC